MNARSPGTASRWAVALACGLSALVEFRSGGSATARAQAPDIKKPGSDRVEAILRKTTDFYKKAGSFAVEVARTQKFGPNGMNSTLSIEFARPNRIAVRTEGDLPGLDLICDGKTVTISIGAMKRYTQSEAPASLDHPGDDPTLKGILLGSLQGTMIGELIGGEPYKSLMDGVKTSEYVGKEPLGDGKAHRLKFTQDRFDWEIWLAADGDPILLKSAMDMTKSLANSPAAAQLKGQKVEMTNTYRGWRIDKAPGQDAFAFKPAEGFKKVGSPAELFGGAGGRAERPSTLIGKPAPPIALKRLDDEGEFRLADHRDKDIVMLDFWATWCGPCVVELPILAKVADEYKDKGVTFFAINLKETPEEIRTFLEEKKLKFNVALDSEGRAGTDYEANAIPMLVLIDRAGIVRSVHVGYDPSIKTTLVRELDALIAGKEIPKAPAETARAPEPPPEGLEPLWSAAGPYSGVATGANGAAIYALRPPDRCDLLDAGGKVIRGFSIGATGQTALRVARRRGGSNGLLAFRLWGHSVLAVKANGMKAWEEAGGDGVDDVWAADLDGDGIDEAIVGYNGSSGLHVFSSLGERIWKRTDIANVWHVTAGDVDGDGKPEVITTSAAGKVHVFAAADGRPLMQLNPGLYATMVRVAPRQARSPSKGDLILVGGSKRSESGHSIAALDADHKVRWTTPLPAGIHSCSVSPDGRWAAVGLSGGLIRVIDARDGKIVASTANQGRIPEVAWAARAKGAGLQLLVATDSAVNAFAIAREAASKAGR